METMISESFSYGGPQGSHTHLFPVDSCFTLQLKDKEMTVDRERPHGQYSQMSIISEKHWFALCHFAGAAGKEIYRTSYPPTQYENFS